jgi:hypothetical protein
MYSSPELSSNSVAAYAGEGQKPAKAANLVYQCVTVAAMLLLLCTMWVF